VIVDNQLIGVTDYP